MGYYKSDKHKWNHKHIIRIDPMIFGVSKYEKQMTFFTGSIFTVETDFSRVETDFSNSNIIW